MAETRILWIHEPNALAPKSSLKCTESSGACKCSLSSRKIFTDNLWAPLRTKSWFLYTNTPITGLCCISFSCHHLPNLQSLQTEIKQLHTPPWKTLVFPSLKFKLEHPRRVLLHLNKESTLHSEPGSFHSLSQCFVPFSISYIYIIYIYIKSPNLQLQRSGWGFGIVLKWKKKSYSLMSSVCLKVFTNTRYMELKFPLLLTLFFLVLMVVDVSSEYYSVLQTRNCSYWADGKYWSELQLLGR